MTLHSFQGRIQVRLYFPAIYTFLIFILLILWCIRINSYEFVLISTQLERIQVNKLCINAVCLYLPNTTFYVSKTQSFNPFPLDVFDILVKLLGNETLFEQTGVGWEAWMLLHARNFMRTFDSTVLFVRIGFRWRIVVSVVVVFLVISRGFGQLGKIVR